MTTGKSGLKTEQKQARVRERNETKLGKMLESIIALGGVVLPKRIAASIADSMRSKGIHVVWFRWGMVVFDYSYEIDRVFTGSICRVRRGLNESLITSHNNLVPAKFVEEIERVDKSFLNEEQRS